MTNRLPSKVLDTAVCVNVHQLCAHPFSHKRGFIDFCENKVSEIFRCLLVNLTFSPLDKFHSFIYKYAHSLLTGIPANRLR